MKKTKQQPSFFLAQWKLMREATRDIRLTAVDHAVLLEILDRNKDEHGNARASWTHLTRTTGRARSAVAESAAKLVALGYLSIVLPGKGTRATTYAPEWGFSPSEPLQRTSTSEPLQRTSLDRSSGLLDDAVDLRSGSHNHLPQPPTGALTVSESSFEVPSAAPPRVAPDGTPEVAALGFEELWEAYGLKTKRAEAKGAFLALRADGDLIGVIVAAARRWSEHYEFRNTPRQYRKQLHTWLRKECYLEDPPASFEAPQRALTTERVLPADNPPEAMPRRCRIVSATVSEGDQGSALSLDLEPVDGGASIVRHLRYLTWEAAELDSLLTATGLPAGTDSDELAGREVVVDGRRYLPAPANDNGKAAAALSVS